MTHVSTGRGLTLGVCLLLAHAGASPGQVTGFDSGSNGDDGDLELTTSGDFDPVERSLDRDGDGVYHFKTITVAPNVVVRFKASILGQGRPIVWLAQGAVRISGTLDLSGSVGHAGGNSAISVPAEAGAGGYFGGPGGRTTGVLPRAGSGPGGGAAGVDLNGGGAGHIAAGTTTTSNGAAGGSSYGNVFLLPLLGGSGGGGGAASGGLNGAGGGGGGGAILIASSESIEVNGTIRANGGSGAGGGNRTGGGGSGGSIRLIAPLISGSGSITVTGGNGGGAAGRIRLEAFHNTYDGGLSPATSSTHAGPGPVFLPPNAPKVRVTAVGGVPVTATPTGSFVTPDVVINSATPVSLDVAGENIPPGTEVRITLVPENGASVTVTATLTGTLASSTGTTSPVTIPHGFSRFFVAATWSPQ